LILANNKFQETSSKKIKIQETSSQKEKAEENKK